MSKILDLRNAIVSTMQGLTGVGERFNGVHLYAHGGEFDTKAELDRYAKQLPAVIVTVVRADMCSVGGEPEAECILAAFVLTGDRPGVKREDSALSLVDNILDYLSRFPTKNFGQDAGRVKNLIARNQYSENFDKRNIAVWGIFWEQSVTLETPIAPVEPPFHRLDVAYVEPGDDAPEAEDVIGTPL